jgi:hypothetical protein
VNRHAKNKYFNIVHFERLEVRDGGRRFYPIYWLSYLRLRSHGLQPTLASETYALQRLPGGGVILFARM